ncbi:MAG: TIGR04141 family sporadically distributed protein, partial [candidate division KSB1 bacterium]
MKDEKPSIHLNIFLVKETVSNSDEIINKNKCSGPIEVSIVGHLNGELYIKKTPEKYPRWFHLFSAQVDAREIYKIPSISAAFLVKVSGRYFVLPFGQGGRFLINDDCCEERFGLFVALNSVERNSFRCVDKQTFDTIQSHSRIQAVRETSADQFGLDVEQDILRAIVGTPQDPILGNRLTGAESLSIDIKVDLADLPALLMCCKTKFEDTSYEVDYPWVKNITEIRKPSSLLNELDSLLIEKLHNPTSLDVWLSVPEIIQWDHVKGFIYSSGGKIIHPDINLKGFLDTVSNRNEITLELLHARKVGCADADHKPVFKDWKIYKCIYA